MYLDIISNMNKLIFLFGFIALIANVTSDEIKFRWNRFYGQLFKIDSRLEKWFNPSKSYNNKWFAKSRILDLIFSTALVWLFDFWHLLKFIVINCVYIMILLALNFNLDFWSFIIVLIVLNLIWGIVFELFFVGIYGALSDMIRKKKGELK
jgi:hypothetical protein